MLPGCGTSRQFAAPQKFGRSWGEADIDGEAVSAGPVADDPARAGAVVMAQSAEACSPTSALGGEADLAQRPALARIVAHRIFASMLTQPERTSGRRRRKSRDASRATCPSNADVIVGDQAASSPLPPTSAF